MGIDYLHPGFNVVIAIEITVSAKDYNDKRVGEDV